MDAVSTSTLAGLQSDYNRFFGTGADGSPLFTVKGVDDLGSLFQNFQQPSASSGIPSWLKNPWVIVAVAVVALWLLLK